MGVPLMRTKTWAYAIGAFFGGIAGAYYASFKSGAVPGDFYFNISVFILCMVILGGMGNVWGVDPRRRVPRVPQPRGARERSARSCNECRDRQFDVPKYQFGIYGVIIVLVMLFRPTGLIPSARHKHELEEGVHDEPLYDVARGDPTDRRRATCSTVGRACARSSAASSPSTTSTSRSRAARSSA